MSCWVLSDTGVMWAYVLSYTGVVCRWGIWGVKFGDNMGGRFLTWGGGGKGEGGNGGGQRGQMERRGVCIHVQEGRAVSGATSWLKVGKRGRGGEARGPGL